VKTKHILFFLLLLGRVLGFSQNNAVVINGAFIVLNGGTSTLGTYFVVNENDTLGIIRLGSGQITSESQYNYIKWNTGTDTGNYIFPFGIGNNIANYIPFTFNKTTQGSSSISLSTWHTTQQNVPYPTATDVGPVTNMAGTPDSVNNAIDRFWDIETSAPTTANLTFSYMGAENTTLYPIDTFKAQHWNGTLWDLQAGPGSLGTVTGIGSIGPIPNQNTFSPWVLTRVKLTSRIINATNLTCNGVCDGQASAATSGGAPGYTYSWNTTPVQTTSTATGLCAGSYTCTVKDVTGCTVTDTITITSPPPFNITITPSGATTICSGDSIKLIAKGGALYTWKPLTGLNSTTADTVIAKPTATTTYTVIGSNGSCNDSTTITITVNPTPTIIATASASTICSGNADSLFAKGATIYAWNPNTGLSSSTKDTVIANPTNTITYTVIGTTGTCFDSAKVTITVNPTPTVLASASVSTICSGNSDSLFAKGATTYAWNPNTGLSSSTKDTVIANPTNTTTYTVIGTTGTCFDSAKVTITVNPTPTVLASASVSTICSGNSDSLFAKGATTYAWNPNTGLSSSTKDTVIANPTNTTTYTVIGTTGTCFDSAKVTITVNPTPTVLASASVSTICSGNSDSLFAKGATTYAWNPNTSLSSSIKDTVIANPTNTTTYTVIGTTSTCFDSAKITITVNPTPTVTASVYAATVCSGATDTLYAVGANTYTWSPNAGLSTSTADTAYLKPSATSTFTVIGITGSCSDSAKIVITVNTTPTITASALSTTICKGDSTKLSANGASSYTWAPNTNLLTPGSASTFANPSSTTTYTVIGNTGGCSDSTKLTLTINPTPTVTAYTHNSTICSGATDSLFAAGATTYIWIPNKGLSSVTSDTVVAKPATSITYTVIGNSGGCTDSAKVILTVNPTPTVTSSALANSICKGDSTKLSAKGATTYIWSPAASLLTPNAASTYASPTSNTTFTVIGTSNGCSDSSKVSITVNPIPTVMVSASISTICSGDSTKLSANGATSYTWAPNTGLSTTSGSAVFVKPTNTVTYTVTGSNGGCSDTALKTITVNPTPTVTISASTNSICKGDSAKLSATGAATYTWSPNTSLTSTTGATTTTYPTTSVTYTVTGKNGSCSDSSKIPIKVTSKPSVTVSASNPIICSGDSTALMATGATTYIWGPNTSLSSTTGANIFASPSSSITYFVVGSNGACVDSAKVSVTVNPTPTVIVSSSSTSLCKGDSTTLSASGAISYTWSPNKGISSTTGTPITATPISSTTYTVIGTSGSCSSSGTVTITVNSTPTASVGSYKENICAGSKINLSASGGSTYSWSPATGLSSISIANPTASPISTTTYTVTISNGPCSAIDSTIVIVSSIPVATLCCDTTINLGGSASLVTTPVSNGYRYIWSPTTDVSCATCPDPTISPKVTGTYFLTITDSGGCKSGDSVTITVIEKCGYVFVPTGFSPNGDGHNDVLYVTAECVTDYYFAVYDRWGNKVFESNDISMGWDGTYKGKPMNPGNYIYYLNTSLVTGQEIKKKGDVLLVR